MHHQEIKQKAIDLRKRGYSYNYIVKFVPVAKSTLGEWLHDIPFTPNKYTIKKIGNARIASGKNRHQVKVDSLKKAELQAQRDIKELSNRDIMMLGLGLYIGEGGKTINITKVTNSDPRIIRFSIRWLFTSFGLGMKNIRIRLHLYPDNNIEDSVKYWSKETGIPKSQFFEASIDRRIDKKESHSGKLPFGTAHMTVKGFKNKEFGVYLHRRIMAWINLVLC